MLPLLSYGWCGEVSIAGRSGQPPQVWVDLTRHPDPNAALIATFAEIGVPLAEIISALDEGEFDTPAAVTPITSSPATAVPEMRVQFGTPTLMVSEPGEPSHLVLVMDPASAPAATPAEFGLHPVQCGITLEDGLGLRRAASAGATATIIPFWGLRQLAAMEAMLRRPMAVVMYPPADAPPNTPPVVVPTVPAMDIPRRAAGAA